jgi:hypothetical protein
MSDDIKILEDLWRVIEEKSSSQDKDSYTKTMLEKDTNTLARKMGEEAIETIVAANTALAPPSVAPSIKSLMQPTPPEAITGIFTADPTAFKRSIS